MTENSGIENAGLSSTAPAPVVSKPDRPGFRNRKWEEDADAGDELNELMNREKAAFKRAAKDVPPAARVSGTEKPGFSALSPEIPTNEEDEKLRGPGWIYCGKDAKGRSTWIKDNGDEIYIPYNRFDGMSDGQKLKVAQIARQRGWGELGVFRGDGFSFDQRAAQQLAHVGLACCARKWNAPGLGTCKNNAQGLHQVSLAERAAQKDQLGLAEELEQTRQKLAQALHTNQAVPK